MLSRHATRFSYQFFLRASCSCYRRFALPGDGTFVLFIFSSGVAILQDFQKHVPESQWRHVFHSNNCRNLNSLSCDGFNYGDRKHPTDFFALTMTCLIFCLRMAKHVLLMSELSPLCMGMCMSCHPQELLLYGASVKLARLLEDRTATAWRCQVAMKK